MLLLHDAPGGNASLAQGWLRQRAHERMKCLVLWPVWDPRTFTCRNWSSAVHTRFLMSHISTGRYLLFFGPLLLVSAPQSSLCPGIISEPLKGADFSISMCWTRFQSVFRYTMWVYILHKHVIDCVILTFLHACAGVLDKAAHEVLDAFLPIVSHFQGKGVTFCNGRWPSSGADDLMGKDSADDPDLARVENQLTRLASGVQATAAAKEGNSSAFL
jgi:hypothetical protein